MLLNLFLTNIPICLEGPLKPLNCNCSQIGIKVYAFIRKSIIQNYVQMSM